jgi:hypothetical protein
MIRKVTKEEREERAAYEALLSQASIREIVSIMPTTTLSDGDSPDREYLVVMGYTDKKGNLQRYARRTVWAQSDIEARRQVQHAMYKDTTKSLSNSDLDCIDSIVSIAGNYSVGDRVRGKQHTSLKGDSSYDMDGKLVSLAQDCTVDSYTGQADATYKAQAVCISCVLIEDHQKAMAEEKAKHDEVINMLSTRYQQMLTTGDNLLIASSKAELKAYGVNR